MLSTFEDNTKFPIQLCSLAFRITAEMKECFVQDLHNRSVPQEGRMIGLLALIS